MIPVTAPGARTALAPLLFLGAAALAAGACGSGGPTEQGPVDRDTYATVMGELADLQRFPPPGPDSVTREARADSLRREILDRHGVTADELLTYAEMAGEQPGLMLEISNRIVAVSDSLARERSGRRDPAPDSDTVDADSVPGDAAPRPRAVTDTAARGAVSDSATPRRALPLSSLRELRERRDSLRGDTTGGPRSP